MMSEMSGSLSSSSSGPKPSSSSISTFSSANCSRRLRVTLSSASTSMMIGRNSSAQLVLGERRGGFRVDALEQARQHLLLDLVDRGLEAADFRAVIVDGVGAVGQARHRVAAVGPARRRRRGASRRGIGGNWSPPGAGAWPLGVGTPPFIGLATPKLARAPAAIPAGPFLRPKALIPTPRNRPVRSGKRATPRAISRFPVVARRW